MTVKSSFSIAATALSLLTYPGSASAAATKLLCEWSAPGNTTPSEFRQSIVTIDHASKTMTSKWTVGTDNPTKLKVLRWDEAFIIGEYRISYSGKENSPTVSSMKTLTLNRYDGTYSESSHFRTRDGKDFYSADDLRKRINAGDYPELVGWLPMFPATAVNGACRPATTKF